MASGRAPVALPRPRLNRGRFHGFQHVWEKFYDFIDDGLLMFQEYFYFFSRNIISRHIPTVEVVKLACDLLDPVELGRLVDWCKAQPDFDAARISRTLGLAG